MSKNWKCPGCGQAASKIQGNESWFRCGSYAKDGKLVGAQHRACLENENKRLREACRNVADALEAKRLHPTDILPIEQPHKLATTLRAALGDKP